MNKLRKHFFSEARRQDLVQKAEVTKLLNATKSLWINVIIYLLITVIEYWLASIGHSQALRADAFNNLSGVISTFVLIVGLHVATNMKDDDFVGKTIPSDTTRDKETIQLSRFRLETIFTLITSFIIILISGQIIIQSATSLFNLGTESHPNLYSAIGAGIATILMLIVWQINLKNGKKLQNSALLAAAKDSLGDVITSLGTLLTVLCAFVFKVAWLDSVVSIVIGCFILWSGLQIFQECTLNLADYIDPTLENNIKKTVEQLSEVCKVVELKGRYNGNVLLVDMIVMVDAKTSAFEVYQLNERIESELDAKFKVFDVSMQIVPDPESLDENDVQF
ncbi:cobalt transporter [Lactobacillus ginsenosidimutans] [Lactiplantibacillus mudanjiangensis]|nr:cobalt transporter [Lactobacillus ginsenosidimutans] [Lactiplantibacillus mudanjiangensis]